MLRDTRLPSKQEYRARYPDARPSERSLKVRRLLREQEQAGALPAALTISRDAKSRCRPGPHRPGCGGSTPPSCRGRVASIAAMQRSLKPQSTGQHRGDPPAFAICAAGGEGCRAEARKCVGGLSSLPGYGLAGHFRPAWLSSDSSSFVNCRANRPTRVRVSPLAPFHAPVAQYIRAGGFEPPGCR